MGMSVEERRERDRIRKREKRAEAAAAREAEQRASRTSAASDVPRTMRDAVADALQHMKWLVPSDVASRTQAEDLARIIDEATHEGNEVRALSAHRALSRVLNDLGGTPSVRLARELRSLKHAANPEGGDERIEGEGGAPDNVTRFQRPAPRSRA